MAEGEPTEKEEEADAGKDAGAAAPTPGAADGERVGVVAAALEEEEVEGAAAELAAPADVLRLPAPSAPRLADGLLLSFSPGATLGALAAQPIVKDAQGNGRGRGEVRRR